MIGRKKNGSVKAVNKANNSKKTELLSKIDQKLNDMGDKYGPIVYEELQSRLEKTIDIFHKDVDSLFSSFSTHKSNTNIDDNSKEKSSKKPKYITDYEKSKKD